MRDARLAYIRRATFAVPAELVVVRDGVQVVATLSNNDLQRLAREALDLLPMRLGSDR